MANAFDKGDVVVLKSGGPPMTVNMVPGEPSGYGREVLKEYHCRWFKGATAAQGSYAEHLLTAYAPPSTK